MQLKYVICEQLVESGFFELIDFGCRRLHNYVQIVSVGARISLYSNFSLTMNHGN